MDHGAGSVGAEGGTAVNREMELCVPCAEELKAGYSVRKIGNIRNKITCENCRRRRYGNRYAVESKQEKRG